MKTLFAFLAALLICSVATAQVCNCNCTDPNCPCVQARLKAAAVTAPEIAAPTVITFDNAPAVRQYSYAPAVRFYSAGPVYARRSFSSSATVVAGAVVTGPQYVTRTRLVRVRPRKQFLLLGD